MDGALLVGLDAGTSGIKACAFDEDGSAVAEGGAPLLTRYAAGGRAEQDAGEWADGAVAALAALAARLGSAAARVAGIGLTGQCPSFALVDGHGRPLTPGILYADNRAVAEAERLADLLGAARVRERTGQWPGAFYVAPKLMWLAVHDPSWAGANAGAGPWLAQPRDLAGLRLTGRLATDDTHAACTLLYDQAMRTWDHDRVRRLGLDWVRLPPVLRPWEVLGPLGGEAARATGLPAGIPVVVGGADSCSAALGCGAIEQGMLSDASGSSTCLDLPLQTPVTCEGVSIYAHLLPDLWLADAGMNATGTLLRWAAEVLAGGDLEELERLAATAPPGSDGLLCSPYLADGERTAPSASGAWAGLSLRHGRAHLARAVYEGLTFGLRAALDGLRAAGLTIEGVRASGGATRGHLWNQLKADVFGVPVTVAAQREAAALGVALLAGAAAGVFASPRAAVACCVRAGERFEPRPALSSTYAAAYAQWRGLVGGPLHSREAERSAGNL